MDRLMLSVVGQSQKYTLQFNECTQKCKSFKSRDVKNAEENQKTSKSSMTEKRGLQKGLQVEKVS